MTIRFSSFQTKRAHRRLCVALLVTSLGTASLADANNNPACDEIKAGAAKGTAYRATAAVLEAAELKVELLAHSCTEDAAKTASLTLESTAETHPSFFVFELVVKQKDDVLFRLSTRNGDWIHEQKTALDDFLRAAQESGEPVVFSKPSELWCKNPQESKSETLVLQWFRYFDAESYSQTHTTAKSSAGDGQSFSQGILENGDQAIEQPEWRMGSSFKTTGSIEPIFEFETNDRNKTKITVGFQFRYQF